MGFGYAMYTFCGYFPSKGKFTKGAIYFFESLCIYEFSHTTCLSFWGEKAHYVLMPATQVFAKKEFDILIFSYPLLMLGELLKKGIIKIVGRRVSKCYRLIFKGQLAGNLVGYLVIHFFSCESSSRTNKIGLGMLKRFKAGQGHA